MIKEIFNMRKENVTIRPSLTLPEKISMTKFLFSSYFTTPEGYGDDTFSYTPYLKELSEITAFFTYCVEGLTFEPLSESPDESNNTESGIESIYDAVKDDTELMASYENVLSPDSRYPLLTAQLMDIRKDVEDMVDFEKKLLLSKQKDALSELLDTLKNKINDIDVSGLDINEFFRAVGRPENKEV